mmetsp:Transcript_90878/g.253877  ORF Transcript_90878/g.253877 Transcript_90878/m.253877 type:complete len:205 (-) Transcript_90878:3-617(-)
MLSMHLDRLAPTLAPTLEAEVTLRCVAAFAGSLATFSPALGREPSTATPSQRAGPWLRPSPRIDCDGSAAKLRLGKGGDRILGLRLCGIPHIGHSARSAPIGPVKREDPAELNCASLLHVILEVLPLDGPSEVADIDHARLVGELLLGVGKTAGSDLRRTRVRRQRCQRWDWRVIQHPRAATQMWRSKHSASIHSRSAGGAKMA